MMFHEYATGGASVLESIQHSIRARRDAAIVAEAFPAEQRPTFGLDDAQRMVLRAIHDDPLFATTFLAAIGWDAINDLRPKPAPVIEPMPSEGVRAVEVSLSDRYKDKALPKNLREDRAGYRYGATIRVWTDSRSYPDPDWHGLANLGSLKRAQADIKRLQNPKKCRTPFSDSYVGWLEETVLPFAEAADALVGFLMHSSKKDGKAYHDQQVIVVPRAILEGDNSTPAMLLTPGPVFVLPPFTSVGSKGKLGGTYICQSRAAANHPHPPFRNYTGWSTGPLGS